MSIAWISPLSAYLPDLLLVHVHPLIIDVGSEEILEAVLDLCSRCCHGDPGTCTQNQYHKQLILRI